MVLVTCNLPRKFANRKFVREHKMYPYRDHYSKKWSTWQFACDRYLGLGSLRSFLPKTWIVRGRITALVIESQTFYLSPIFHLYAACYFTFYNFNFCFQFSIVPNNNRENMCKVIKIFNRLIKCRKRNIFRLKKYLNKLKNLSWKYGFQFYIDMKEFAISQLVYKKKLRNDTST